MHFISSKENLLRAITIASKATSKLQKTVLESILFETENGKVILKATDISLSIETELEAQVIDEGRFALPARYLIDIISKFPESDVTIKNISDESVEIICMNSNIKFMCMDADEFPSFPERFTGSFAKLSEKKLRGIINETLFAVSTAEDKPLLTGIHFEIENNVLEAAALDGFRMAVRDEDVVYDGTLDFTLPSRAAREILHIANDTEETVKFACLENMAMFEFKGTTIYTRLLEGKYIEYKNLIPGNQTIDMICDRDAFYSAVERAAIMARDRNNIIKMDISNSVLEITSESQIGNIDEKIPVIQNGDDISIAFNAKNIMEVLRVMPDDEIKMSFSSPLSPSVMTGTATPGYLYLVLPLNI